MSDNVSRIILSEREFHPDEPISIATGVPIETITKIPDGENETPISDYKHLLVHTRTLFRNLLGSLKTKDRDYITAITLAEALSTEMKIIETLVTEATNNECEITFYQCGYTKIFNEFKNSIPKLPTTPLQRFLHSLEEATLKQLETELINRPEILYIDRTLNNYPGKGLILTHFPVDLLNRYKFSRLNLLESHTGAIKTPVHFSTKLREGSGLDQIPFDRMTLQLFGDNQHFRPMDINVRKVIQNLAIQFNWTWATTKDYVIKCSKSKKDVFLTDFIKKLYRS